MNRTVRMIVVGVLQVLVGCLVGLIPPPAVMHFRSVVTAHIEFTANGTLLAVLGLITPYMRLSGPLFTLYELLAYLGTWSNGGAFVVAAFTGSGTKLSPTISEKFPFPNGIEGGYSDFITSMLLFCAVTVISALALGLVGLFSYNEEKSTNKTL
eukprot:gene35779-43397_t